MINGGRLFSQVAAEAGVTSEQALVACYLNSLSEQGKTLDHAATLLRKGRSHVRDLARDWGISFADYQPMASPVRLEWRKVKRGEWGLFAGEERLAAIANPDGDGGYTAASTIAGERLLEDGSKAEIAIGRLSRAMDRIAQKLFDTDDLVVAMVTAAGPVTLVPKTAPDPERLRRALRLAA